MSLVVEQSISREILCDRLNFLEGSKRFTCRMIEPGIVSYLNTPERDVILLRKETIDRCLASAMGKAVTIDHVQDLEVPVPESEKAGSVASVRYNAEDGWFYVEGEMDDTARSLVKKGQKPSCAYREKAVRLNTTGEKYHGFHFDKEITDLEFHHLAVVPRGKYEGATFRLNSIPTMKLFKLITTFLSKRKNDAGADVEVSEEKSVDIPQDTMVDLGDGKKARLNELGQAWMDQTAKAATCDEIDIPAAGELPACKVKTADLVSHYNASRKNEADAKKKAEDEKVVTDANTVRVNAEQAAEAARKNEAGKAAFDQLSGARFKTTSNDPGYSTTSGSLKEKCERGAKRY